MKSKIAIALLSAATLVGFGTAAFAGPYGGGAINARQDRQDRRIEQGVRSGELTRWEIRKLRSEQKDIAELERCLRQYGGRGLQGFERRSLQKLLNVASKNIRKLKHNGSRSYRNNRRHSNSDNNHHGNRHVDNNRRRGGRFSWLRNK